MQGRQSGQSKRTRGIRAPFLGVVLAAGFLLPVADLKATDRHNPWASGSPEVQRSAPERPRGRFPDRDYDPSRRGESHRAPSLPQQSSTYPGYGHGPHGAYGSAGAPAFYIPGGMPGGYSYGYPGSPGYPGMGWPFSVFPLGTGGFPFP